MGGNITQSSTRLGNRIVVIATSPSLASLKASKVPEEVVASTVG